MTTGGQKRDARLDNARFALMLLVVIGHAIEPLKEQLDALKGLYIFIYLFHIPAFAFVSGVVSPREITRDGGARLLGRVAAPLALFALLYAVLQHVSSGTLRVDPTWLAPYKHLWFLVSLLSWRLLLPLCGASWWAVAAAAAAGLLVGYENGINETLSIDRTVVFFPFFLLGNRLGAAPLTALDRPTVRVAAAAVLLTAIALSFLFPGEIRYGLFFGKMSYAQLGWHDATAAWHRAIAYGITALTGAAFLAWVPRRPGLLTAAGQRTMASYLLHMAPIVVLVAGGCYRELVVRLPEWVVVAVLVAGAVALHAVLSLAIVTRALAVALSPSPRQARYVLAAVVAAAAALVFWPSLNHAGAAWASAADLPRAEAAIGPGCDGCRDVPVSGLVVTLGRAAHGSRVELGLAPRLRYRVELFGGNRRLLARRVTATGDGNTAKIEIDLPNTVAAAGWDAALVTPEGGEGVPRLGWIRP